MFFALSKLGGFVLTPSNLLIGLALLGLLTALAVPGLTSVGLRVALATILLLAAIGYGPLAAWLLVPLEERFPASTGEGQVDGIVVLGGAIRPTTSFARGQISLGESAERLTAMADLGRRHPDATLVFTGGSGALIEDEPAEAAALARFAPSLGLDPGRILFENRSRTTWENATETKALVSPAPGSRWLLVTSAWHMPRAVGVFRSAGWTVEAYPVDYQTSDRSDLWRLQGRFPIGLDRFDTAAREWIGLLAYRVTGRTRELFPGP